RSDPQMRQQADKPLSKEGGFQLIFQDRYLMLIAALVVLLNVVNTSGEFLLGKLVVSEAARAFPDAAMVAERQKFIGGLYGEFFGWVNITGLLLQTFFVSRIFKAIGPGGALFVGPSVALVGYSVILVAPVLGLVRILKILDNSIDYSIQNTARQAL